MAKSRPTMRLHGGQMGRRLRNWNPGLETVDAALLAGGGTLLRRAREMAHSNAYVGRAKSLYSGYAIRDGIRPSIKRDGTTVTRVKELWEEWVEDCDADQCDDFYGLQSLVAEELFIGGEAFILRTPSDNALDMAMKVLPAEMLPYHSVHALPQANNEIRQGIEFAPDGRRVAYHFYEKHPGDITTHQNYSNEFRRVPAEDVIHVYMRESAGQQRGLSKLANAMIRLHLLDGYDDAELDRQRVAALFAGFVRKSIDATVSEPSFFDEDEGDPGVGSTYGNQADDEAKFVDLAPGVMQVLEPGEDVTFSNPPQIQGQYEAFQQRQLMAIASSLGMPYHVLTGDVAAANFSASRAAQLDFKVEIQRFQKRAIVGQMCKRVQRWFLEAAILEGLLRPINRNDNWTWNLPRWDWVDPQSEVKAAALEVENNFTSRRRVVEARGYSVDEIDEEIEGDPYHLGGEQPEPPQDGGQPPAGPQQGAGGEPQARGRKVIYLRRKKAPEPQ